MLWRRRSGRDLIDETSEIARHSGGGRLAAIVSAVALTFSAVSLYQTVLKQPELHIYVPSTIHYTREAGSNLEVLAVPITIANHGARDGAVVEINLSIGREKTDATKMFTSTYFVEGAYFVGSDTFNPDTRRFDKKTRPKVPFAPISIAGRNSFSGTVLFYTTSKPFPKMVHEKGDYKLTLTLMTRGDESLGLLDRMWRSEPKPISFVTALSYFSERELQRGATHRMKRALRHASADER